MPTYNAPIMPYIYTIGTYRVYIEFERAVLSYTSKNVYTKDNDVIGSLQKWFYNNINYIILLCNIEFNIYYTSWPLGPF